MRKEVGYAIVAGIILGLIVAFGVYRINSEVSRNKTTSKTTKPYPTPTPSGPKEFKVVLDRPGQNDVITEDTVTLSGLTKANLWIIVSGESRDYITKANVSGGFSQDVDLIPGVNQIKVTAFNQEGSQVSSGTLIVYSSSFVEKNAADTSDSKNASDSVDVKKKVAADLAHTLNQPKAYIGTVTDVTDSTIELKSKKGDIQQISVGTQTTSVVNSVGTTTKTVKTSDIAIGDFIVAMGYVQENSVLSAQRILITSAITDPKVTINMAKVTDTSKKALSLSTLPENKPDTVTPDTKTRIETYKDDKPVTFKFASISDDDTILYVQAPNAKGDTVIRSIYQIPQS